MASGAQHPRRPTLVAKKVRGAAHRRVALAGMAGAAGLRLCLLRHGLAIGFLMDTMAAQAPDTGGLVLAASPEHHVLVRKVAGETGFRHRFGFILNLIADEPRVAGVDVSLRIAGMAGNAGQFVCPQSELHGLSMRARAKLTRDRLVTVDTGSEAAPTRLTIRAERDYTRKE